jgi:hypothetical protein
MMNLPEHLIMEIYEYDGRYKENYNKLMREIGNLNNKYIITKNTIVDSMNIYVYILPSESIEYLRDVKNSSFSSWFFKKFDY